MKKTIGIIIIAIIMLLILTGCTANVDYEITINKDGSGEIGYIYKISKDTLKQYNITEDDIIGSLKEQAEKDEYEIEKYENDDFFGFKARKTVKDVTESLQEALGDNYIDDSVDNRVKIDKSFLKTNMSQNAKIDLTEVSDMVTMSFAINLPSKVIESNATEVSKNGKTLTWELTSGEVNEIKFKTTMINIKTILVIIIAIVIIVFVGIIIILKITNKKDNKAKKEIEIKPLNKTKTVETNKEEQKKEDVSNGSKPLHEEEPKKEEKLKKEETVEKETTTKNKDEKTVKKPTATKKKTTQIKKTSIPKEKTPQKPNTKTVKTKKDETKTEK